MIMVLGITGTGKSTFINFLKPDSVQVGNTLESGKIQFLECKRENNLSEVFPTVDTPGFDDSKLSDAAIFTQIAEYLAAQFSLGIPLRGMIYIHQIQGTRMRGSEKQSLKTFERLCQGPTNLRNVMFLTTGWDSFQDPRILARREQELIKKYWTPMMQRGARVERFPETQDQAKHLIMKLVSEGEDLVFDIQPELLMQEKRTSGASMAEWYKEHFGQEMDKSIGARIQEKIRKEKNKLRYKLSALKGSRALIQVFSSVVGIILVSLNFFTIFGAIGM
ncbi:hypothetical protein QBC38DRAFT_418468 [Podospora fimiseda]|uniref:G domain-containing protein n=1 Tax=Podospora fimiseda TaxID=252190 RepID=A0AAN7BNQ7_9PEZI|nr:hypothetical protein QBC38DRAFT_418468 [Podospora fimiseda]